jgi:hypothetical protein
MFGKDKNPPPGWYYCTKHNRVEHLEVCKAADRLGPYPDEATAARALEIARERTASADEADRKWNSDG